ncbi:hypothetical protein [Candidatus Nitrososphaera sp. FF02]|uniref:hypothetical protein n=1 Tax=Candidatus Nitrososphaera sp. FF02 TaxID=3398226 RepID=UPI0039E8A9A6
MKYNREHDTAQIGFMMFEDTLLAYMNASMKYAEEIKRLKAIADSPTKKAKRSSHNEHLTKVKESLSNYYETGGI